MAEYILIPASSPRAARHTTTPFLPATERLTQFSKGISTKYLDADDDVFGAGDLPRLFKSLGAHY